MSKYVSMEEAAELLGVSYKTIQRKVKNKTFKSIKKGNTRQVLYLSLGLDDNALKDKEKDIESEKSGQSPIEERTVSPTPEIDRLWQLVEKQQSSIDKQNDRLSEVNKLILGVQGQLTQLNQTLQLSAGIGQSNQDNSDIQNGQVRDNAGQTTDRVGDNEAKNSPEDVPSDVRVPKINKKRLYVIVGVFIAVLMASGGLFALNYYQIINLW